MVTVLTVFVGLAVWYSLTVPLGEAPDEVPHFTYVRYLAQHRRLPTTTEEHEAFQPPLYYLVGAAITFWIEEEADAPFAIYANAYYDAHDPRAPKNLLLHSAKEQWPFRGWVLAWHLVRLWSIVLGAITVWAIYQLGRVLFSMESVVPLMMASLAAFTPQFIFLSAVVNNDNAATCLSALILWQMVALLHETDPVSSWKRSALLGVLSGLGMLSKASLFTLLPVVGLAIALSPVRDQRPEVSPPGRCWVLSAAGRLSLAFGLALLISGWYYLRNWSLYGDPLGWSFLLQINALREGPLTWEILAWLGKGVFRSFWLGWIGIEFEPAIYWLIAAACLIGLAGCIVWLVHDQHSLGRSARESLLLLGLHAVLTVGSLVQWTATVLGSDQGRLLYPILPAVMLVLAAGWSWWIRGRMRTWMLGGLVLGILVLAVLTPIRYIGPVHAPARQAAGSELATAVPLHVNWEDIQLLGYRLEGNPVRPGEKLVLHLYWQGLRPIEDNVMALIQLIDEEGRFLMYRDGTPTAGRDTTDRWAPRIPLTSEHLLPIPDNGQPGTYRLTISLHPCGEPRWLPVSGPDGKLIGDSFILPETIQVIDR
ncbi:MAG: glycosyltransferase family 39 protein [Anaerolineae bacterium]